MTTSTNAPTSAAVWPSEPLRLMSAFMYILNCIT
jgi:hypothetical protein